MNGKKAQEKSGQGVDNAGEFVYTNPERLGNTNHFFKRVVSYN